ncbi:MAG: FHA domain-containing protein [Pirellulales bacterium]|nr:FHA domain-containing protein [Pirellulales bacterium]
MVGTTLDTVSPEKGENLSDNHQNFLLLQRAEAPQTLQLKGSRISIGSDPDCNLRLLDATVARMHALIIFGQSRTIIRSLEEGFSLNGTPLTEAELQPGDLLSVGESQIIFLSENQQFEENGKSNSDGGNWRELEAQFQHSCQVIEQRFDHLQQLVDNVESEERTSAERLQAVQSTIHDQIERGQSADQRLGYVESELSRISAAAAERFRELAGSETHFRQAQTEISQRVEQLHQQWEEQQRKQGQLQESQVHIADGVQKARAELSQQAAKLHQQIENWLAKAADQFSKSNGSVEQFEAELNHTREEQSRLQQELDHLKKRDGEDHIAREQLESLAEQMAGLQQHNNPQFNELTQRLDTLVNRQDETSRTMSAVQASLDELRSKMAMDKFYFERRITEKSADDDSHYEDDRSSNIEQKEVTDLPADDTGVSESPTDSFPSSDVTDSLPAFAEPDETVSDSGIAPFEPQFIQPEVDQAEEPIESEQSSEPLVTASESVENLSNADGVFDVGSTDGELTFEVPPADPETNREDDTAEFQPDFQADEQCDPYQDDQEQSLTSLDEILSKYAPAEDDAKEEPEVPRSVDVTSSSDNPQFETDPISATNYDDNVGAEATQAQTQVTAEPQVEEEGETSIEDYMAQLMNRVQGGPTGVQPTTVQQSETVVEPVSIGLTEPVETDATDSPDAEQHPESQPTRSRTRPVPMEPSSLAAMRDLANMSTRGALATHSRKQKINSVQLKLILAVAALAGSLILLWFSHTSHNIFAYVGSVASMLVAIFFGVRYLMLTGQLFEKDGQKLNSTTSDASDKEQDSTSQAEAESR